MAALDIGEAADANDGDYRAKAQTLLEADNSGDRSDLARIFEHAVPSTNAFAWKIGYFDAARGVMSASELAAARSAASTEDATSIYSGMQKEYFVRREAFEAMWVDGRSFVYLAANPGHTGIEKYGDFCLVIDPNRVANPSSAIFPENSLHTYTDDAGTLDRDRALAEVGPWRRRSDVAVVKREADIPGWAIAEWPTSICCEACFVEVVTAGPIDVAHVVELRLNPRDAARLASLAASLRSGRLSNPDEIEMARAFIAVRSWPNVQLNIGHSVKS